MLVMILETVPVGTRGELSRWLMELSPGVFVGTVSALVRDLLWELVCKNVKKGGVTQIFRTNNEQGFSIRQTGVTSREIVDFDGLILVKKPKTE